MAYTILFIPAITHRHGWWVVEEVWPPLMAARFAANGALGYLYSADPFFVAGPLGPIVLIPVIMVGDALRLTDSYRYNVPHPTMWLVYGPFALGLGAVLLHAARALAQRVWVDEGLASREIQPRHLRTQLAMVGLVLVPAGIVYGHFEDILALAFVLLGIRSILSGRFGRAALWFGLAIGMKQWAVLGLPILIAATPTGSRVRMLVRSFLLPGALMAFTLAVDWGHAAPALLNARSFPQLARGLVGASLGGDGHAVAPAVGGHSDRGGAGLVAPRANTAAAAPGCVCSGLSVSSRLAAPATRDVLRREEVLDEPAGEPSMAISPVSDLSHIAT